VRIGVFALSSPFPVETYAAGCALLRRWGHELVEAPGLTARRDYLAGDDAHRWAGFEDLLARDDLDLLMAARGGYGVHRLLDRMQPAHLRAAPPILGFSDLTALHAARYALTGGWGLHGPVITQLATLPDAELDTVRVGLERLGSGTTLSAATGSGRAQGILYGGNLALLSGLLGTPYDRWPSDTLLLLEDVSEAPYRVDRMLTQLELAGRVGQVRGVAVGDFVTGSPPRPDPDVQAVLQERLSRWAVPIQFGLPVGHGARNRIVPVGRRARMEGDLLHVE
jgi:muramoyltetrapeptide carboxypeptidase